MILALDQATRTGYAVYDPAKAQLVTFGAVSFAARPGDPVGQNFRNCSRWLNAMMGQYVVTMTIHERLGAFKFSSSRSTICAGGWIALIEANAGKNGSLVESYAPSSVKKHVAGNGKASKEAVLEAVRKRWPAITIDDLDASDALALLAHHLIQIEPEPPTTNLELNL